MIKLGLLLSKQASSLSPSLPDTNINDLAFFCSLQLCSINKGTLIASINQAFALCEWKKLRHLLLSLRCCYNSAIEAYYGDNKYKIKHMNKAKFEKQGKLPPAIVATDWAKQFYEELDDEKMEDGDNNFPCLLSHGGSF